MIDTGQSIGYELITEIARQDMIHVVPKPEGGYTFLWRQNADEQLEGHLYHLLKGRGLAITKFEKSNG